MAVTLLESIFNRVKTTLQETTRAGTRWTNSELLEWLNESYQAIIQIKPDASAINQEILLAAGSKQSIPDNGLRLIDVIRNTSLASRGEGILICSRKQLDATRRDWHREQQSEDIEHYIFDDLDPKTFYVYPPASSGAKIEIVFSSVPAPHQVSDTIPDDVIKLDDSYAPAVVDYMLHRAYSKDADHSVNIQRAQMHYQAFMTSLGKKVQVDYATSPNNPQTI